MNLVDANVLIYAYDSTSRLHDPARRWVEAAFSGPEPVHLCWATVQAFLRITTNHRILAAPLPMGDAAAIVEEWLAQPAVAILEPGVRYWPILKNLLVAAQVRGALVSDAHLAALAIEHGATLLTTDRDFSRFTGLRFENPLT